MNNLHYVRQLAINAKSQVPTIPSQWRGSAAQAAGQSLAQLRAAINVLIGAVDNDIQALNTPS